MTPLYVAAVVMVFALAVEVWHCRARLPRKPVPPGFQPTDEVFTDPTTGVRQRVWYNPDTGKRHYEILDDKGK